MFLPIVICLLLDTFLVSMGSINQSINWSVDQSINQFLYFLQFWRITWTYTWRHVQKCKQQEKVQWRLELFTKATQKHLGRHITRTETGNQHTILLTSKNKETKGTREYRSGMVYNKVPLERNEGAGRRSRSNHMMDKWLLNNPGFIFKQTA